MVGGATHHHQQQQQQQEQAPQSNAPITTPEEEEFLKRNTDCVYFLASPLTCKKGSECEYRHSDVARVNPRDCWYWLNGNCLNPKCAFRHPPLDGLLGAEVPTPNGPSVPQLQTPVTPKQGVACIFFQKGFCLKGHLCPFLHGPPNSVNFKAQQSVPANPSTEPPKTSVPGPEKSIRDQKFTPQANVQKPVEFLPPQGKQLPRMQAPPPARNGGGGATEKNIPPPLSLSVEEPPRYRTANVVAPPVLNEISSSRLNRGVYQVHHVSDTDGILNGKDSDGYSRDPSPGFDVLVDNELEDSEFYHNEDQFGRSRGRSYDLDQDMYREQRDYDHYNERDQPQGGRYAWDDHRVSSERMLAHLERNRNPRNGSPEQFDESDLRHRISKQRRGNNNNSLRSVVSRERERDSHSDRMHRRDEDHHHRDQGLISSRLRGRIKMPGRSTSPHNEDDLRAAGSPRPPHAFSDQGRLRDRIKGRVSDDYNNDRRDYRGSRGRQDTGSDNGFEFTGPKRLSELKGGRSGEGFEQSLGKRKYPRVDSQQSEGDLSFEGPKPLSEILKRKRRAGTTTAADTHISSTNKDVNNLKEVKKKEENIQQERKEESKSVAVEFGEAEKHTDSVNANKDKVRTDGQFSLNRNEVNEEGLIDEDAMLDQELEAYDHRDGDYDYEQIDGEDYNLDEGENPDEEYLDEEGGNEYSKKENVMYS